MPNVIEGLKLNSPVTQMRYPPRRELFQRITVNPTPYESESDFKGRIMPDRTFSKIEQLDTGARVFFAGYGESIRQQIELAKKEQSSIAVTSDDSTK